VDGGGTLRRHSGWAVRDGGRHSGRTGTLWRPPGTAEIYPDEVKARSRMSRTALASDASRESR